MKHLKIGDQAPAFSATLENGSKLDSTSLKGKKWVLYFYPKDLTPGCTTQACNIRDNYEVLKQQGIEIYGVSMDSEKLHQRFIEKFDLPFHLIADEDRSIIEAYGVWGTKKFMGKVYDGIHRTTFVINEENVIIDIIEKPKVKDHAAEIMQSFEKK
jgi:peroxiredoxin Q/BCP